jgi:hypothetical protein
VGSLPRESIRQVLDVVERPDEATPYTSLKERLLAAHELTDFWRIEKLFHMEPMGAQKPSELLNHMLELCPRGEEKNKFFLFLFLQCLPKELRVLLTEADLQLQETLDLATKADRHWAMLTHQMHGMITAVEPDTEDPDISAVQHAGRGRQQGRRGGLG